MPLTKEEIENFRQRMLKFPLEKRLEIYHLTRELIKEREIKKAYAEILARITSKP